jgi:hypothetical protein
MNYKRKMLAAVCGQAVDRIPWVPRLDLWYRARRRAGTLPAKYQKASLVEILDDLGWGHHAVIPDFQDLRGPEDEADRALGIYNLHAMPVRTVLENVQRRITPSGDRRLVEYLTPAGNLAAETLYNEAMRAAGITITHVTRYAFRGPDDYPPLKHLFRNARVEPNYDGYAAWAGQVGDRGFAAAYVHSAASPMHVIQKELMPLETFFFELHDRPDEVAELAACIAGYWRRLLDAAAGCPAEVFLLGANYDAAIQHPAFFAQYITPWLAEFTERLHARGRFLLTHTDGENRGLLEQYLAARFDVADSVCPRPMTKLSLAEVRRAFAGRITIMGGIPSVALIKESMDDRRFGAFLDGFFAELDGGDHLILGVSDTTPPGAEFDRLLQIARRIEEFGPVREPLRRDRGTL